MAITITGFEDLILGEDGNSAEAISRCIRQAYDHVREDKARIRVEIRTKHKGSPSSRQETSFNVDPTTCSVDDLKRHLIDKLEQSPGPEFSGQVRINFTPVGSSGTNIGSFAREVVYTSASALARVRDEEDEDGDEENSPGRMFHRPPIQDMGQSHDSGAILMNPQQLHQWMEVTMGFAFRAMAQNMTMFDRTTRMLENYSLRFGLPQNNPPGVVEVREERTTPQAPPGGGILPMLLQAVAGLASANQAPPPPPQAPPSPGRGALNRIAAVQHAGEAIGRVRPRVPVEGFEPPPPLPRDDGSRGGRHQAEDEEPRYPMSRRDSSEMRHFEEDQGVGQDEPDQDPGMDPMAAIKQASADEMMELVKAWVTASAENKAEIMKRLPDLTSLLM